jgi:uracil-DNA glycosylase
MDKFVTKKSPEKPKSTEEEVKIPVLPQKKGKKPSSSGIPASVPSTTSSMSYEDWENQLHPTWKVALQSFLSSGKLRKIYDWVSKEYADNVCRPVSQEIFTAFSLTPFDKVKVVIVGQDPYPGPVEAMGLSFSVHRGVAVPGSLKNIYKCLQQDKKLNFVPPRHGDLTAWAEQGVFMLNAVLSVRQGVANSHAKKGWEAFTDKVIKVINKDRDGVVFMLWGAYAQAKASSVDKKKHSILEACHPSPLSASKGGFYSCGHFSKANEYLKSKGIAEINWNLNS